MVTPIRPTLPRKGSEIFRTRRRFRTRITYQHGVAVNNVYESQMGRFEISLKPGHYVVVSPRIDSQQPCGPFEVSVGQGKLTNGDWRCDSEAVGKVFV